MNNIRMLRKREEVSDQKPQLWNWSYILSVMEDVSLHMTLRWFDKGPASVLEEAREWA